MGRRIRGGAQKNERIKAARQLLSTIMTYGAFRKIERAREIAMILTGIGKARPLDR